MRVGLRFLACGLAVLLAGHAVPAVEPESAWSRAGVPVKAAGAFVPPPGTQQEVARALERYAVYDDRGGGGILDEVRLGVLGFWQQNATSEEGVYVAGQVLFDPLFSPFSNRILDVLLRPRPHVGASASFDGTDQLFAGLTWTVPIWRSVFIEASFGGTIHNGPLSGAEVSLGCRVLFRESIGVGVDITDRWRVIAGVDHSSHNEFCGQNNDGLTHVGAYVGYRF